MTLELEETEYTSLSHNIVQKFDRAVDCKGTMWESDVIEDVRYFVFQYRDDEEPHCTLTKYGGKPGTVTIPTTLIETPYVIMQVNFIEHNGPGNTRRMSWNYLLTYHVNMDLPEHMHVEIVRKSLGESPYGWYPKLETALLITEPHEWREEECVVDEVRARERENRESQ